MKIRTLITPSLLAAGLLLGMTTAVQADSGHAPASLHKDYNAHHVGYRYGHDRHYRGGHHYRGNCGRYCREHKGKHWYRGHGHRNKHGRHHDYFDEVYSNDRDNGHWRKHDRDNRRRHSS